MDSNRNNTPDTGGRSAAELRFLERKRVAARAKYLRVKADPERLAIHRATQRRAKEAAKARKAGVVPTPVAREPFRLQWADEDQT